MDYGNLFVCLMGMGTVFFGLVCLIALTRLMSIALHCVRQKPEAAVPAVPAAAASPAAGAITPELVAAVSAAVAEDLGTDITGIRILSIKPL
ncbi:OadG family protein [Dysosmobacter sp.]|uniref:OadG family protein n=1 Tax=Dysosmobacter sp. TaxID=2591382 RepID=UPI003A95C856